MYNTPGSCNALIVTMVYIYMKLLRKLYTSNITWRVIYCDHFVTDWCLVSITLYQMHCDRMCLTHHVMIVAKTLLKLSRKTQKRHKDRFYETKNSKYCVNEMSFVFTVCAQGLTVCARSGTHVIT